VTVTRGILPSMGPFEELTILQVQILYLQRCTIASGPGISRGLAAFRGLCGGERRWANLKMARSSRGRMQAGFKTGIIPHAGRPWHGEAWERAAKTARTDGLMGASFAFCIMSLSGFRPHRKEPTLLFRRGKSIRSAESQVLEPPRRESGCRSRNRRACACSGGTKTHGGMGSVDRRPTRCQSDIPRQSVGAGSGTMATTAFGDGGEAVADTDLSDIALAHCIVLGTCGAAA
jgi:hypothetical protein